MLGHGLAESYLRSIGTPMTSRQHTLPSNWSMKKVTRKKNRLENLLTSADTPVFLLGADRRVLFFNSGCEQLTGWTAADVLGQICEYASSSQIDGAKSLTETICPPPEVMHGAEKDVPAYITHRSGRTSSRIVRYFPLHDTDGGLRGVLGLISRIEQPPAAKAFTPAQTLHAELAAMRVAMRQRFGLDGFVCHSDVMSRVASQIKLAAANLATVFLRGESGTGKQFVARLIYYQGEPGGRPFVTLDCERLSALELKQSLWRLLEQEELASDESPPRILRPGALYLAHVDALPRDLQKRLVEAIRVQHLGPESDLRLFTSSTHDPASAHQRERFRDDFYYLITTVCLELPPLRERRADLHKLSQSFLESFNRGDERQMGGFSEHVWERFDEYGWPGNMTELQLVVEEARLGCNRRIDPGRGFAVSISRRI